MKHSKLFSLVQHLPEKETALLAKNIKTHKRDTMQKLFAALVKSKKEDEPRPEDVFKTVFGKKYAKSSDYLLRNEYRFCTIGCRNKCLATYQPIQKLMLLFSYMTCSG
ncbi:MAG: hypothetical protein IPH78_05065 [Bacteroidetes bacterium]|nr:hypothetical protein [Bacteroidota bacterium]